MRKFLLVLLLSMSASLVTLSAQVRFDLGVDIPRGFGAFMNDGSDWEDVGDALSNYIIPFPEASIHYAIPAGPVTVGLGGRCFTFILESVVWPNAFVELEFRHVAIDAQFGGGLFLLFGLYQGTESGKVFFPDLSIWLKMGNTARLGGGAMGFYVDGIADDVFPVVWYLGFKAVIRDDSEKDTADAAGMH